MSDNTILIREKENPPRKKEEFSKLTITVSINGEPKNDKTCKSTSLKMPKPLVKKVEGPFNEQGKLVEKMIEGQEYIFKATEFQESTFTPIKHIWWAEQVDDGEITDLEYKKGKNPYLDDKKVVCFKYKAKKAEKIKIYAYVATPTEKVSILSKVVNKSKMYFVPGAGNDLIGWNYTNRFKTIWTKLGISGFKKINAPSGSDYMAKYVVPINDLIYVSQNRETVAHRGTNESLAIGERQKAAHRQAREKIVKDLENTFNEINQLNLCGYSYGSVVVSQSAIQLCNDGYIIDNLILIGSPIPKDSELYKTLKSYEAKGKIRQIIRHDIKDDMFSNPSNTIEYLSGAMDSGNNNPHFDLARPDDPQTPNVNEEKVANEEIKKLGELLISKGIH